MRQAGGERRPVEEDPPRPALGARDGHAAVEEVELVPAAQHRLLRVGEGEALGRLHPAREMLSLPLSVSLSLAISLSRSLSLSLASCIQPSSSSCGPAASSWSSLSAAQPPRSCSAGRGAGRKTLIRCGWRPGMEVHPIRPREAGEQALDFQWVLDCEVTVESAVLACTPSVTIRMTSKNAALIFS